MNNNNKYRKALRVSRPATQSIQIYHRALQKLHFEHVISPSHFNPLNF